MRGREPSLGVIATTRTRRSLLTASHARRQGDDSSRTRYNREITVAGRSREITVVTYQSGFRQSWSLPAGCHVAGGPRTTGGQGQGDLITWQSCHQAMPIDINVCEIQQSPKGLYSASCKTNPVIVHKVISYKRKPLLTG